MDDYKNALPPLVSTPGLKIRIPPELMPDDQTATHYFDLFFAHMHPYIPVLSRSLFYQQWNSDRYSISPLILEAMFAIGGRLADEPALGQQWLALASSMSLCSVTCHNNEVADQFQSMPIPSWTCHD